MQYIPSTQPETIAQLLGRSLRLYRLTFLKVFFLSFLIAITTFLPRIIALFTGYDVFADLPPWSPNKLWLILISLAGLALLMGIFWRLQCVTTNSHESLKADLSMALKKLPLVLVAVVVESLIFGLIGLATYGFQTFMIAQHLPYQTNYWYLILVSLPLIFQLFVSVYVYILFIFYFPLILTENDGPVFALRRSAELVWGNWWKTVWVVNIPWIFYLLVLMSMQSSGIQTHIYFFRPEAVTPLATCLHVIAFALFVPWVAATILVRLRDLELRKPLLVRKPRTPRVRKPRVKKKA